MTTTAWRLLQQDMHLTPEESRTLTALLASTPVAARGEETLVQLSHVLPTLSKAISPRDRLRNEEVAERNVRQLSELLGRSWRFERGDGRWSAFPFVADWSLVKESQLLRYRLNPALLDFLEQVKLAHGLEALF